MSYRDRSLIILVIGALMLLIGIVAAFLGPLEIYCFYLFSEGGRFHYEGFGFGSFMFGNIACQILGYYLIAAVFVPLGYGHVTRRRWARTLSLTLLWFWLVVGVPLIIVLLFMTLSVKDMSPAAALVLLVLLGLSYLVVPGLLIRFYQSIDVRQTFEAKDPNPHWIEALPMPTLVLCALFLFYTVVLHVPILFNGMFPVFGIWMHGMEGIFLIDAAILCLAFLVWGTLKLRIWAWWGSLVYFGMLTFSSILTLSRSSLMDILSRMNLPEREMEMLQGLPLHGSHFAAFFGIPFVATLGLIVLSRRHFGRSPALPAIDPPVH